MPQPPAQVKDGWFFDDQAIFGVLQFVSNLNFLTVLI
jgi:hypothetical protein